VTLLLIAGLLLLGISAVLVLRAIALPSIEAAARVEGIGHYGFAASAPEAGRSDAGRPAFSDLAANLGAALARRFDGLRPESLRKELLAAGLYRISPAALLGYRFLGVVALGTFGLLSAMSMPLVGGVFFVAVLVALGWLVPLFLVRRRATGRLDRIERELPELIDLLVVTVEAGMGLGASLQLATKRLRGPLVEELRLALQEQRMGRSLNEALLGMLERVETPGMRSFVRSVNQGEQLGVSIGVIMRNLAVEMRGRRRASAEERAQKAPTKILFPLVFLILPAFLVVVLGPSVIALSKSFGG